LKLLTPRQKEIVGLVAYSNFQIAQILKISEKTVKNHLRDARENLGLPPGRQQRVSIVTAALKAGEIAWQDVAVGDRRMDVDLW